MPYLDGLPAAVSVSSSDIIAIDQGGTPGVPGTATTRRATVAQLGLGASVQSVVGATGIITLANLVSGGVATAASVTAENARALAAEALLAPKANPTLTGTPAAPTATFGTNTTQIASTAFVQAAVVGSVAGVASVNAKTGVVTLTVSDIPTAAPLASPTFTGTPAAPTAAATAAAGTTQIATTAFVRNGTTTNDNALSGQIGQYISATVLVGAAVALTNNTPTNITSISLTPGDWDVTATVADNPAGTTVPATLFGAISTTNSSLGTSPASGGYAANTSARPAGFAMTMPIGTTRLALASTTTVYLVAMSAFTVSTMGAYGFIGARRAR
jgi:hypothetical protein